MSLIFGGSGAKGGDLEMIVSISRGTPIHIIDLKP